MQIYKNIFSGGSLLPGHTVGQGTPGMEPEYDPTHHEGGTLCSKNANFDPTVEKMLIRNRIQRIE